MSREHVVPARMRELREKAPRWTPEELTEYRLWTIRKLIQDTRVALRDEYASQNCRLRIRKLLDRASLLVDCELRP